MKKCKCEKELIDFEEIKFGLCWECISQNDDLLEKNPNLGEIQEYEDGNGVEKYSITIRNKEDSHVTFGAKSKGKKSTTVKNLDDSVGVEDEDKKKTPKGKDADKGKDIEDPENVEELEEVTTKSGNGKKDSPIETEEGMKVIRESREILTQISRAKARSFAIINQSIKETGVFNVVALVEGKSLSVSSEPFEEGDIENIKMTTTMEVHDDKEVKKKK